MKNVYAVSDHKINGRYQVTFGGTMSKKDAQAEAERLNAPAAVATVEKHENGDWDYYTPAQFDPYAKVTEKSLEKLEKMQEQAHYCKRCGQSDVFDGIQFTNGGGDICDDCF